VGVSAPAAIPFKMGRKIDTLGCLTKIFVKWYVICMITPSMMEKCRKHSKPAKLQAHICRDSKAVEKVPQPDITQRDDILEDLSQLYAEQEEHDAEQI
jgi:hypothetical protein